MKGRIRAAVVAATVLGLVIASVGSAQAGPPSQPSMRDARAAAVASGDIASMASGATWSTTWANANPVTSVYLVGASPQGSYPITCQFEVTRMTYLQRINSNGSSERQITISFKNLGGTTCGGLAELQTLPA
ncbi:hypothetical protein ABZU25_23000 [Micromonospora sp. NPDC005215]|uniref:hypothetical protein n=1 Tax=Micromonospora sp. NPDC005215 TaxID=3157024 RepID=UPI0033AF5E7E